MRWPATNCFSFFSPCCVLFEFNLFCYRKKLVSVRRSQKVKKFNHELVFIFGSNRCPVSMCCFVHMLRHLSFGIHIALISPILSLLRVINTIHHQIEQWFTVYRPTSCLTQFQCRHSTRKCEGDLWKLIRRNAKRKWIAVSNISNNNKQHCT